MRIYGDGAFTAFRGVVPESVLYRLRKNCVAVEGLFCKLGEAAARVDTDSEFLTAVEAALAGTTTNTDADCIRSLQDSALKSQGGEHWFYACATVVNKYATQIQKDLMSKAIIPCYIEWCETEKHAQPGFACKDSCLVFNPGLKIQKVMDARYALEALGNSIPVYSAIFVSITIRL